MDSGKLAARLFELVPTDNRYEREPAILIGEGEWRELPTEAPDLGSVRDRAGSVIRELDDALKRESWPRPSFFDPEPGYWTLGSVEQRAPIRKIHHGYLEPIRRFSVIEHVPDLVVAFLARIPGWKDYVKRENHPGVGWHYHYLRSPTERSDVLLAWDTRWQAPTTPPKNATPSPHPFFGEKHAEKDADFAAKPWLWGDKKKESMHGVCAPDLKRSITEFRCASNHAEPVWPSTGKVTPQSGAPSPTVSAGDTKSHAGATHHKSRHNR